MIKSQQTVQVITQRSIVLALIGSVVLFFVANDPRAAVTGYLIGTLVSILGFRLMARSLTKSILMAKKKSVPFISTNYLIRYVFYGVFLAIAVFSDKISFITVLAGYFTVKIVIVSSNAFQRFQIK